MIVSYAQNFEDVMLWRALKEVENGFYIDVGANDPRIDSVTQLFYDHGWRGINVEPEAEMLERLERDRPEDTNLGVAVGAENGEVTFYVSSVRGWSTISREASRELEERASLREARTVPMLTLDSLCDTYVSTEVHFLKIDVEGAEKAVLEGFSFRVRPWIVVVEAVSPGREEGENPEWEPLLTRQGYRKAWFDGINAFYLAQEHASLLRHFRTPPNVLDDFVTAGQWWAMEREARLAENLEQTRERYERLLHETRERMAHYRREAESCRRMYVEVTQSRSWRVTLPLRRAGKVARNLRECGRSGALSREMILGVKHRLNAHPRIKEGVMKLLAPFPGLRERLRRAGDLEPREGSAARSERLGEEAERLYEALSVRMEEELA